MMNRFFTPVYTFLIAPKALDDKLRRKEVILNILLVVSLFFAAVAFLFDTFERLRFKSGYDGVSASVVPGVFLFFLVLFMLSRRRQIILPSFLLITLYYLVATFCLYRWGIDVPIGLLIYALVITLSGILVSGKTAIVSTLLILISLAVVYGLGSSGIIHPDLIWKTKQAEFVDLPVISFAFLILFFVSWLSGKEIEHSLERALDSEVTLKKERDTLEATVERRTAELRQAQRIETLQLYELAEVGRLSSSLLHDMLNPLATVSLTLERLRSGEASDLLERAIRNTRKIEQVVTLARKQLRSDRLTAQFKPLDEISDVLELFSDRLQRASIAVQVIGDTDIELVGDPIRFHRLVSNLIANAIDAYEPLMNLEDHQPILIELKSNNPNVLELSITDHGYGMEKDVLHQAFTPFFSTKHSRQGSGIGLGICKEIVEHNFGGNIRIASKPGFGTTVSLTLKDQDALPN